MPAIFFCKQANSRSWEQAYAYVVRKNRERPPPSPAYTTLILLRCLVLHVLYRFMKKRIEHVLPMYMISPYLTSDS